MTRLILRSLLLVACVATMSACSNQETKDGGHESSGKKERKCRTVKRTGSRTGFQACDHG
jgi:hypothetical protein